ncbi:uncharacterized protein BP5553_06119 [Venustampulla echinocandica]|uniref:Aminotransferase class V domain-containing protein n=1 Tax=Venustampulla echinocandica TaxID=2656787 RepID=A0A370TMM2_9HELO|nr:uncharacterized protein BP5553_06119 [Venustampulla echinocandica]RDL36767.1 hypothetical protein BP5553_06119 [Venustampulla echinocandica]
MSYNKGVENFRDTEYPMMQGQIYLDHGGSTIYAKSLIDQFSKKMMSNLYGNPHSGSDPAHLSGQAVDQVREATLRFFGADPEHFDLVFTANATAAIKCVADNFRDLALASSPSGTFWYGYHKDAHTSLVGVRELTSGTHHCFASDGEVEDWLNGHLPPSLLCSGAGLPGLFAYPGQSNMTGRRLPLSWTAKLRQSSKPSHQNTYSLLDAAALATTTQIDLSDANAAPDFTAVSFYKIFGFPDLGALIVRRKSGHILSWRKYFGGGTVNMLTVLHETTVQRKDTTIHDALEDGTLPFHSIIALGCAMQVHQQLYGSMSRISQHTSFLFQRLYAGMVGLRHFNGRPVCVPYNESSARCSFADPRTQGATIAFNIVDADGYYVGPSVVEYLANEKGIYLRSGGLCNAGGIASYLKVEPWQFKRAWSSGYRCGAAGPLEIINGKPTGVVRASLGAMSTIEDVDTFVDFLLVTFVEVLGHQAKPPQELVTRGVYHDGEDSLRKDSGFASSIDGNPMGMSTSQQDPAEFCIERGPVRPRVRLTKSFSNRVGDFDADKAGLPPQIFRRETENSARISAAQALANEKVNMDQGHRLRRQESRISLKFWKGPKSIFSTDR